MNEEKFRTLFVSQFARLADQAGTYVGRMCRRDREIVLEGALSMAWDMRDKLQTRKMTIVYFWDQCLKAVVQARNYWTVRHFDRWTLKPSRFIGAEIGVADDEDG